MSDRIHVERELHIAAPEGDAVYVTGPTYTRAAGTSLVASVRHEALSVKPDGSKSYYSRRLYRRHSEDNGRTWIDDADGDADGSRAGRYPGTVILDRMHDVLIMLHCTFEIDPDEAFMAIGNRSGRTRRMFHQLSRDGGSTWTDARQIIDERPEFDELHWAPGIRFGEEGGIAAGQPVFMEDGTLALGFDVSHPEPPPGNTTPRVQEHYASTIYARARLNEDASALSWRFGDEITVEFPKSSDGCCEQAATCLGGSRLFNTMRCQGDEGNGIYSTRYTTLSEDGGMTWTRPEPLKYDDGDTVWTPASVHRFFTSSKTGKTYVLANILPGPVHAQMPRYPLTIAEFDTTRLCVLRDTVQVIQDLPDGAPVQRRYTNWGDYEERGSGDLIMMMPEQPKFMDFSAMTRPEQYTADCIKIRVRFDG